MIFTTLKLNNIGLYKGENILELTPKNGNIVLFGGKNGSGKTTILDSVKLCLYGNNILGLSKKEYEKFIKKFIHKGQEKGEISLNFIYFTENGKENYEVIRRWEISKKLKEEFILLKDGYFFKNIPKDYWQDFISDIIPPGLINFFFFDGEKIEKLAEDLTEIEFVQDIKNLIGVTLIEDLYKNIGLIEKKYLKEENLPTSLLNRLQQLEKENHLKEMELSKLVQERSQINMKISTLNKDLNLIEKEFNQKGGKFFRDYEKLKAKSEILKKEIEDLKQDIKELSSKDLPLAIGLDLIEELVKQLDIELKIKKVLLEEKILKEKFNKVISILKNINIPKESLNELKSLFSISEKPKGEIIHNLSENEIEQIKVIFYNLQENLIKKSTELFESLEKKEEELIQINLALENVPKEEIIAPYVKQIKKLEEEKIKLTFSLNQIEEKIKLIEREKKSIEKEFAKLEKEIKQRTKKERVLETIEKTKKFLDKFKAKFTARRLSILKREILEALSRLERKEDFISDLDINQETFEITLYDRNRRVIPLDRLSSGERQIFAISFLWGLAKTSGKALPVIIDTPLGRLDSDHRENFAKNYFPNISHQVIILSTDVEINQDLLKFLSNNISHAYHLEYDHSCMCTKVQKGYFWKNFLLIGEKNEV